MSDYYHIMSPNHQEDTNEFIKRVSIYDVEDLKIHYERRTRGYFFSKDTMQGWGSRVSSTLFYSLATRRVYFVTSEKRDGDLERTYSTRSYDPESGMIDNLDEFGMFKSLREAKNAVSNRLIDEGGEIATVNRGLMELQREDTCPS